jgi:hypothetical protein
MFKLALETFIQRLHIIVMIILAVTKICSRSEMNKRIWNWKQKQNQSKSETIVVMVTVNAQAFRMTLSKTIKI